MTAENFYDVTDSMLKDMSEDDPMYAELTAQKEEYGRKKNEYMTSGGMAAYEITMQKALIEQKRTAGEAIENTFATAMGGMLREGYWTNDQYIPGQEDALYADALEISAQMAFPTDTWNVTYEDLTGAEDQAFEINQALKILDGEMKEKGMAYVDKLTYVPRRPDKLNVTITTDE